MVGTERTICSSCDAETQASDRFCADCGQPLGESLDLSFCPDCEAEIELSKKFCDNCGRSLAVSEEEEDGIESRDVSGRPLVVAVIVASLSVSALVILSYNIRLGPQALPQQIVRFLLTCGLCVFLYQGANWARWVVGVLSGLGGLLSMIAGFAALMTNMAGLLLIAMGLLYVACMIVLLFVPTVRKYFGVVNSAAI